MSCNNCQNTHNPCNCASTYEPCITDPLVIACDNPEYCEDVYSDKCIVHTGSNLANIGATEGIRLDVILSNINTLIGSTTATGLISLIEGSPELQTLIYNIANPVAD